MNKRTFNRAQRRRRERAASRPASPHRWIAAAVTALLIAVVIAIVIINRKAVPESAMATVNPATLRVGERAPSFSVTTLDGRTIDSERINGPLMVEIFATWCPHCQRETAVLDQLHRQLGRSLTMVAVTGSGLAADHSSAESPQDVQAFVRYFGVPYAVAYDPNLTVANRYFQGGFPTIVFIDSRKRISAIEEGEIPLRHLVADARKAGAV